MVVTAAVTSFLGSGSHRDVVNVGYTVCVRALLSDSVFWI